jgi:hypothetical protein
MPRAEEIDHFFVGVLVCTAGPGPREPSEGEGIEAPEGSVGERLALEGMKGEPEEALSSPVRGTAGSSRAEVGIVVAVDGRYDSQSLGSGGTGGIVPRPGDSSPRLTASSGAVMTMLWIDDASLPALERRSAFIDDPERGPPAESEVIEVESREPLTLEKAVDEDDARLIERPSLEGGRAMAVAACDVLRLDGPELGPPPMERLRWGGCDCCGEG